ncbi:MAG: two-component regulator propeller domain-containing protein [Bacteroidota bacterium]
MKAFLSFCLVLMCTCLFKHAGANNYPPFSYFGIEQGLSNNAVRTIFQDSKGFMWFGTYDGLNKYDGYTCKVFRNDFSDSLSLINNWINSITEDASGRLWIGTRKGLCIFNSIEGDFLPVYVSSSKANNISRFTGVVKQVLRTAEGNTLIATQHEGLLIGNHQSTTVKEARFLLNGQPITNYDVQVIEAISQDTYLMAVLDIGICIFDAKTGTVRLVNNGVRDASCIEHVGSAFWIGSDRGIVLYDPQSNTISPASSIHKELSATKVIDILLDHSKDIWIATNGDGVIVFHPLTGQADHLNTETKPALSSNAVYRVFEDREYRKWIGTIRGGINIVDEEKNRFTTIRQDPYNANSVASNFILSYYEALNGHLWIGTDGGGLSVWNRSTNTFTNFKKDAAIASSLSDNFILNIQQDSSHNIWLNTYYGGINRSGPERGIFSHYHLYNPADPSKELLTYSLCIDRKNTIWVGTLSLGGLYRYNKEVDRFDLFDNQLKDLFVIKEDKAGQLWGGNLTQLVSIDTKTKQHDFFAIGQPVRCITEDHQNRFWVGTEGGGLILFDRSQGKILQRYTIQNGLCNNAVLTILPDDAGHLWISTFNGLSMFDIATGSFKNYYQNDGLQSNQFNYNAAIRLHSGEFVFGGIKGMNIFFPQQIKSIKTTPPLVLTDVLINNDNPFKDPEITASRAAGTVTGFTVPFSKAVFSFDFAALEYSSPEKISYAYRMEGWDKDWIAAGSGRRAVYTHLKEGRYTFRVKCTNPEGGWSSKEFHLSITVLPPWYRSWWAYILYTIMIATAIYFYNRYRMQKARLHYSLTIANLNAENEREKAAKERAEKEREHAELERERFEREKDLAEFEKERANHEKDRVLNEKEKEINDKKLEFFTNIAHEFRTPLTLIINPVKELIDQQPAENPHAGELKMVYHNAHRMINLVDQLLLFQKGESGMNQLRLEKLDFPGFVREVYMGFSQQARLKQIDYQIKGTTERMEIWADRSKLEIILYNIFSNALKYTPSGGKVTCSITETELEAELVVIDSGKGIPSEAGDRVFDRFYRADDAGTTRQSGFGIGLFLVKQFVDAHHGKISYTSQQGRGTSFTLSFLKGMEHFEPSLIVETAAQKLIDKNPGEEAPPQPLLPIDTGVTDGDIGNESLITETKSILVIDDDAQMLQYITGIFKNDYSVYNAGSGEEGLLLAQKYLPDIIISDIRMGGISGIDLCKTIKQDPVSGHIPVILLTGTSSSSTRLESIEGGADDYIVKPFEKQILVATVENLLQKKNALQNYFYNAITLQQNNLKISSDYKEFIERCIQIVEENLDDQEFGVQTLIRKLGMSRSNLFRKVKSVSGLSIISFIRFIRLRKAAQLFTSTNLNVNETAAEVGIQDQKYFRKQFQKLFGLNPSEYISKYRKTFHDKYNINRDQFDGGNQGS